MKKRTTRRRASKKTSSRSISSRRVIRAKKRARSQKTANHRYQADRSFELFEELRALILKALPESFPDIELSLKRLGGVHLAVVTGAFFNLETARVDFLIVGNRIDMRKLTNIIKEIEVDLGKEIRYVLLSTDEFRYRYEMYDRFLRDILEYPHQKVINRLGI